MKKRRSSHGLQMFSFLDAMVCTVGALLVLLHAFARHGANDAQKKAEVLAAAVANDSYDREQFEKQLADWTAARETLSAQLADSQMALAHIEDHYRRLLSQLDELRAAADALDSSSRGSTEEMQAIQAELAAVRARTDEARDAVEAARRNAKPVASYSIVPYDGAHGTRRRPVYIECRGDCLVLQPEGVEISVQDFAGIIGPGNPLAATMRGVREHWAHHDKTSPGDKSDEPYPMLLVRPEGVRFYQLARLSLESWGADFGYELVCDDWSINFPEPDPQLAELEKQIIADSRLRMRELAVATKQLARERQRSGYRWRSAGGVVPDRATRKGTGDIFDTLGAGRSNGGPGKWSDSDGTGGFESSGSRFAGSGAQGALREGRGFGSSDMQGEEGQWGSPTAERSRSGSRDSLANNPRSSAGAGGDSQAKNGTPSASSGAAGSNSGQSGESTARIGLPAAGQKSQDAKASSLAKSRGKNWGLPDAGANTAGVTRPILIDCHNDRLVIASEERGQPPKEIPLGDKTRDSMDELVTAVWDHMKGWGIAGKGFYWKPTLLVSVTPGAADRYADVKTLLADSGLDVHERGANSTPPQAPSAAQAPRPKTSR